MGGHHLKLPEGSSFKYLPKVGMYAECCSSTAYQVTWKLILPANYSSFMIVPYSTVWGVLDAGPMIRITDNTGEEPTPEVRGIARSAAPRATAFSAVVVAVAAAVVV